MSHPDKPLRIGEILVQQGVLSEQQVFEILEAQRKHAVPFGVLAELMFDVTIESIERAWVEQYHNFTGTVDLAHEDVDLEVLKLINRRQAWQFEIIPLRFDPEGELLVAASRQRLARAVTFVAKRLTPVVIFRIAESEQLQQFLMQHYPMPAISKEMVKLARGMV